MPLCKITTASVCMLCLCDCCLYMYCLCVCIHANCVHSCLYIMYIIYTYICNLSIEVSIYICVQAYIQIVKVYFKKKISAKKSVLERKAPVLKYNSAYFFIVTTYEKVEWKVTIEGNKVLQFLYICTKKLRFLVKLCASCLPALF